MTQGENDMGSTDAIERAQLEMIERLATSRMQVAALHTALKTARGALDDGGKMPEELARQIDEALGFGEPDGIAIFASMRSLVAAARDPERHAELKTLADRIETLIGTHDGL